MSGKLVGEVADWLVTPAADGLGCAERCILFTIAERANEKTRLMWRHRGDDQTLYERIRATTGLDKSSLAHAFQRLRKAGVEVRVPIKHGKDGRPIFSHRGVATTFKLPKFPASVAIPERVPQEAPISPVDNPAEEAPDDGERVPEEAPIDEKGCLTGQPLPGKGASGGTPIPLKNTPSTTDPSKDIPRLSAVADVEDAPPAAFEEPKFDHDEYEAALKQLMRLPDFGTPLVDRMKSDEPGACHEIHVIHAARLVKGIPA